MRVKQIMDAIVNKIFWSQRPGRFSGGVYVLDGGRRFHYVNGLGWRIEIVEAEDRVKIHKPTPRLPA